MSHSSSRADFTFLQKLGIVLLVGLIPIALWIFVWDTGASTEIGVTLTTNQTLEDGLVGHWTFDGQDVDWASTTAEILDRSQSGLHGDATSTTHTSYTVRDVMVPGVLGQGFKSLYVASTTILMDSFPGTFPTETLTTAFWVKRNEQRSGNIITSAHCSGCSSGRQYRIYWSTGRMRVSTSDVNTSEIPDLIGDSNADSWQHVTIVFDGANEKIYFYKNGEFFAEDNASTSLQLDPGGTHKLAIGYSSLPDTENRELAELDDVRIYNRALSPAEVKRLYEMGEATKVAQTPDHDDGFLCGSSMVTGDNAIRYGTVLGEDGNCWLDRNLGATRVAQSLTDPQAYGYYYQWGRATDGHQVSSSVTTSTLATTDTPGHGDFIVNDTSPYDWRNPQNDTLWQGAAGTNNVCPAGFRLPTSDEWTTYVADASITNSATAYASNLKLPVAGNRYRASGDLNDVGNVGYYWSSSVSGASARRLLVYGGGVSPASAYNRAYGFTVRCLRDSNDTTITLETGLVGHWTFDGQDVDWGSTTAEIKDRSGNNNHGDAQGGMTTQSVTPGVLGQGMSFDGVDDKVSGFDVGDSVSQFSWSMWIKPYVDDAGVVIADRGVNTSNQIKLSFSNDRKLRNYVYDADGDNAIAYGSTVHDYNDWIHAVGVFDGTTSYVYSNGQLDGTDSNVDLDPINLSGSFDLQIGLFNVSNDPFNGVVDDVRIYNRALSPAEVKRLYEMGEATKVAETIKTPTSPLETGLVGHWTFDGQDVDWGSTTAEIKDRSGNNNHGDAQGGMNTQSVTPGVLGQGMGFDGVANSIVASQTSIPINEPFAASFWMKPSSLGAVPLGWMLNADWGVTYRADNGGTGGLAVHNEDTQNPIISYKYGTYLTEHEWQHIAFSFEGGEITLYRNGQVVMPTGVGVAFNLLHNNVHIGFRRGGLTYFDGTLDDVRIYNRALSAEEVKRLYEMGR